MTKVIFGFVCLLATLGVSAQQVQVEVHYVNGRRIETNCYRPAPCVTQQVIVVNSAPCVSVSPAMQRQLYNAQQECDRQAYNQQEDYNRRVYNDYADSYRYSSSYCRPVYTRPCYNDRWSYFDYRNCGRGGSSFDLQIGGRDFSFGIGIRSDHRSDYRSGHRYGRR